MTAKEMTPAVGATVVVACDGLNVLCTVEDCKTSWGRPRLLVRPVAGSGEVWIEMSRVSLVTLAESVRRQQGESLRMAIQTGVL